MQRIYYCETGNVLACLHKMLCHGCLGGCAGYSYVHEKSAIGTHEPSHEQSTTATDRTAQSYTAMTTHFVVETLRSNRYSDFEPEDRRNEPSSPSLVPVQQPGRWSAIVQHLIVPAERCICKSHDELTAAGDFKSLGQMSTVFFNSATCMRSCIAEH